MRRQRGMTLLEVLISMTILALLVVAACEVLASGQNACDNATSLANARVQAQRALDAIVTELRPAAAWTLAAWSPAPAPGQVTPLTSWDETAGQLRFDFAPADALLFYRIADSGFATGTPSPYIVFDYEPAGLGVAGPTWEDYNGNGTTLAGRMDDDQLKARVLLRVRTVGGRALLERVLSPAADGPSTIPEVALALVDLGPATGLPANVAAPFTSFASAGPGLVSVTVHTCSRMESRGLVSWTTADLSTVVSLAALAPPR